MDPLFSGKAVSASGNLLGQLCADGVEPSKALLRIAGFHLGRGDALAPLRTTHIKAGDQTFPAPEAIAPLLGLLLARAQRSFAESGSMLEDCRVAGFLLWGLVAIHPFENANGRTARDLTQYVLMMRWGTASPPFAKEERIDHALRPLFVRLEPRNDGSPGRAAAQLMELERLIETASLASLESDPTFAEMGRVLADVASRSLS